MSRQRRLGKTMNSGQRRARRLRNRAIRQWKRSRALNLEQWAAADEASAYRGAPPEVFREIANDTARQWFGWSRKAAFTGKRPG